MVCKCLWWPEEGIAFPGAQATVGSEQKGICAGKQDQDIWEEPQGFLVEMSHRFFSTLYQFILDGS